MARNAMGSFVLLLALASSCAGQQILGRHETYATPMGTSGLAVGDFDGDGWLDIASSNQNTEHNGYLGLTVYYNRQGAGFGGRTDCLTGHRPFGVTAADFNRDGLADLAVATYYSQQFEVRYSRPEGGFTEPVCLAVDERPYGVAAVDLTNDGILDLVDNGITAYRGLATGGFVDKQYSQPYWGSYEKPVAADLNGDGFIDLARVMGIGQRIEVHVGNGSTSFSVSEFYNISGKSEHMIAADLNNDSRLDLALICYEPRKLVTMFGLATGGFSNAREYSLGIRPLGLVCADFNLDGLADIAVGQGLDENGRITVFTGQGGGLLGVAQEIPCDTNAYGMVAGDFDKDGRPDLAVTGRATYTGAFDSFTVYYNEVPEPGTVGLVAAGLGAVWLRRRRDRARC